MPGLSTSPGRDSDARLRLLLRSRWQAPARARLTAAPAAGASGVLPVRAGGPWATANAQADRVTDSAAEFEPAARPEARAHHRDRDKVDSDHRELKHLETHTRSHLLVVCHIPGK